MEVDDSETACGRQATGTSSLAMPLVDAHSVVLMPRKNSTSVVWRYFGFEKGDVDQKHTTCKVCMKTVATSQSNTSNLFHHLEHNHPAEFEAVQVAKQSEKGGNVSARATTK